MEEYKTIRENIKTIKDLKIWYPHAKVIYGAVTYSPNDSQYFLMKKTDVKQQLFHLHDSTSINGYYEYNKHSIGGAIFLG